MNNNRKRTAEDASFDDEGRSDNKKQRREPEGKAKEEEEEEDKRVIFLLKPKDKDDRALAPLFGMMDETLWNAVEQQLSEGFDVQLTHPYEAGIVLSEVQYVIRERVEPKKFKRVEKLLTKDFNFGLYGYRLKVVF
jgi:hypothetical protein